MVARSGPILSRWSLVRRCDAGCVQASRRLCAGTRARLCAGSGRGDGSFGCEVVGASRGLRAGRQSVDADKGFPAGFRRRDRCSVGLRGLIVSNGPANRVLIGGSGFRVRGTRRWLRCDEEEKDQERDFGSHFGVVAVLPVPDMDTGGKRCKTDDEK